MSESRILLPDEDELLTAEALPTYEVTLQEVRFVFINVEETDLASFEPKNVDDLAVAANLLGRLKKLRPQDAFSGTQKLQGDLTALWFEKLNSWENDLAQKAEQMLSEIT